MTRPIVRAAARSAAIGAILLFSTACASGRPAGGSGPLPEPDEVWSTAPVPAAAAEPERDILGSAVYDLPVEANSWVEAELDFLVGERREVIAHWLERGDFYEPYIKEVLRAHEIPTDLYHIAMIESGFVPTARSHAGAVGMWQFMPATGREMGLRVDAEVDERMDPVRATRAAARHLRSLHRSLGDWALAAAAYNAGGGRIRRGLAGFGASDFWDLAHRGDLAEETRRYVPRLYAVTVIARDRARFGFPPPALGDEFAYDSVNVEYATPLDELARLGGVGVDRLRRLNPHLLKGITPAGGYWVWAPSGTGTEMQRAWLASDFRRDRGVGRYTVRSGDNLSMLAERSGVPAARILEMNPSVRFDPLQVGVDLKLPYAAAESLAALPARQASAAPVAASAATRAVEPDSTPSAEPGPAREREPHARHEVQPGETLWSISRRYDVTVSALERANALEGSAIRAGQVLTIPDTSAGDPPRSPRGSPPAASEPSIIEHVVSEGETLWSIAQRYGSSVAAIQGANSLGDTAIHPGQRLIIPPSAGSRH